METGLHIPWLEYEEIKEKANNFLHTYHLLDEIPIPIEEVVEFQLNLDIVPIPGLHTILDTDGFLYGDLSAIAVDDFVYSNRLVTSAKVRRESKIMQQSVIASEAWQSHVVWREILKGLPRRFRSSQ